MMKNGLIAVCLLLIAWGLPVVAAPYAEEGMRVNWTQPDGHHIELKVFGDEYYARTETADGRTVVYHAEDKSYRYAELSADGQSFKATSARARKTSPVQIKKHLSLPAQAVKKIRQQRRQKFAPEREQRWRAKVERFRQERLKREKAAEKKQTLRGVMIQRRVEDSGGGATAAVVSPTDIESTGAALVSEAGPAMATTVGSKVGLTILVQFPDDPETQEVDDPTHFPTSQSKIERYCNEVSYTDNGNTGSVRDYFWDQSNQDLSYTQLVTQIVTLPNARDYYNYSDYPDNETFRDAGSTGRLLVAEAIAELRASGFDFSTLSTDSSNNVIATNLMFAGNHSGVWAQGLWPSSWYMNPKMNVSQTSTPLYVRDYQITNISSSAPVVGTFIHENGHMLLDLPDLYDYGGQSEGVGRHCLMGSGNHLNSGKTPAPINAYFKAVSGWHANMVDLDVTSYQTVSLPTTGNHAYRIVKPGTSTEYFMVENRGSGDKWAQYCLDKGIMIWHIDETFSGNDDEQMTPAQHYQVSLEQADGAFDLENDRDRGDAYDLFDASSNVFDDSSLPNAHWWDGSASGIKMDVLSSPGSSMNVLFGSPFCEVSLPNGGEIFYCGGSYQITWFNNLTENVKIELYKSGGFHSVIAENESNDGSFTWLVDSSLPLASDYQIRVSSVATTSISDLSDGHFSLASELFPEGGVLASGWTTPSDTTSGWEVTNDEASEGLYSLRNIDIDNNESAGVEYSAVFQSGQVSFDAKVGTQAGRDYLFFYIDGVEQDLDSLNTDQGLSGVVDWTAFSFPVTEGVHTFKWIYDKNASRSGNGDTVWIDRVAFPAAGLTAYETWKETHFAQDAGNTLISGDSVDVDDDGVQNLTEYALGRDPGVKNSPPVLAVSVADDVISMVFTRNLAATDISISFEKSTDAGNSDAWLPVAVTEQVLSTVGNIETVRAMISDGGGDRIFLRMKVDLQTP